MATSTKNVVTMTVPFVDLASQHKDLQHELLQAVANVFDHAQFILGREVQELELQWAKRCQVEQAVGVSNGTDALRLVLQAIDVGPGDEVIVPPNSFVGTASAVIHAGAIPRFADVGDDLNLSPASVNQAIRARTKAIIAVHLTGRPADMAALKTIADKHGILLVEDAAQAMGARFDGKPVGGLGCCACFSLHPLKTAGACGDAGMITTQDSALAEKLRLLRNHGITQRQEDCQLWGYNARLDTIQAALALVKLKHVHAWTQRRRDHAAIYRYALADVVRMPADRPGDIAVYHTFPVECADRDHLATYLAQRGIGTAIHYRKPIHLLDAAKGLGYQRGDFPVAERLADHCLSLPINESLAEESIRYVCQAVREFYNR